MNECLDEHAILSFCQGTMAAADRSRVEHHIAECDDCRALLSVAFRSSVATPGANDALAPTTPVQRGDPSLALPSAPVHKGDVLAGKYVVESVLGVGGMGVVVAARHAQLDRPIALKFLLPVACEAPGAVARFLREGKAAARITSEHVARVIDTGVLDNGSPYLVMEYLEGSDLGAVLEQRRTLPPEVAVDYVLQVSEALVEAHQLGIVHRDLKPANLFLTFRRDGSSLVKVLDFGISKITDGSQNQLTSTSMVMGSPRYMSPEQMLSPKDVDARTDVWALGAILYELVAGVPAWQADTVQGLCALIASAPAPSLRQRAPHAPQILEDAILRCFVKSQAGRMPSVADLAVALEPLAPESARPSIDRILRIAGRDRASMRVPAAPPAAGVPLSNPPVSRTPVSNAPPVRSQAASSHRRAPVVVAIFALLVVLGVLLRQGLLARPHKASTIRTEPSTPIPEAPVSLEPAPATTPLAIEPAPTVSPPTPPTASVAKKSRHPRTHSSAGATLPDPSHNAAPALPPPEPPDRAMSDRK